MIFSISSHSPLRANVNIFSFMLMSVPSVTQHQVILSDSTDPTMGVSQFSRSGRNNNKYNQETDEEL
jgi:hypothetical protein